MARSSSLILQESSFCADPMLGRQLVCNWETEKHDWKSQT